MTAQITFYGLAGVTLAGALVVVFTREVMRLVLGLGAFLLGVAGLFLYLGSPFLAAAQVFVYVGGVLVLVLFAIMALVRDPEGRPSLCNRPDIGAASVSVGLFALLVATIGVDSDKLRALPVPGGGIDALGHELLGAYLPQFEAIGVLLLAALVAVLAISGKGERS